MNLLSFGYRNSYISKKKFLINGCHLVGNAL
nr:MAG TPA: hypothetical protein [Caudoviricetes sp.]